MGITLFRRKIKDGRYSLYLSSYINGKRKKEALGIILEKEKDKTSKDMNQARLAVARALLLKKQLEHLYHLIPNFKPETPPSENAKGKKEINLLDLFDTQVSKTNQTEARLQRTSLKHLKNYMKASTLHPSSVTKTFCKEFLDFLYGKFKGNTPSIYFKKFKNFLNYCTEERYINKNPALNIHPVQQDSVTKEILTPEEVKKLAQTPCSNNSVKRAFLFSCFSGLRWCDIKPLRYNNIDFPDSRLDIVQKKVSTHSKNAVLHLNLNKSALKIIGSPPPDRNKEIFPLPNRTYTIKVLKNWTEAAGIKKHITFHCARHTFITMLISAGVEIKTASLLAGHSSTRHTEKYIHISDKQKKKQ